MAKLYKVPLVLSEQPEGGYVVTSPVLPELLTEGNDLEEALENIHDALSAVIEIYEDLGKPLPADVLQAPNGIQISFEQLIVEQ